MIGIEEGKSGDLMQKRLVVNVLQGVVVLTEQMSNFFEPDLQILAQS